MTFETTRKNRALWLLLALAGCGGAETANPGPMVPGPTNSAQPNQAAGSDLATCQRACSTMVGCGVEYDATCASNCMKTPLFLTCARTAIDCNALALCAFRVDSALTCGGETGGYPAGSETCGTTALCEGMCAVANQPASCRCACNARMAPNHAINLLINNQCALARCPAQCGPGGNGPACVTCFQGACQAQNAQCTAAAPARSLPPTSSGGELNLPVTPTEEPAPSGALDQQLFGTWPVSSVQVYWDGSGTPDWSVSDPLKARLASAPLMLAGDGSFRFGAVAGAWTIVPFTPADKPLWGTGGRGPEGYPRKIVLSVGGKIYAQGPVEDPIPPATAPSGVRLAFRVEAPRAGNIILMLQRPAGSSPGLRR